MKLFHVLLVLLTTVIAIAHDRPLFLTVVVVLVVAVVACGYHPLEAGAGCQNRIGAMCDPWWDTMMARRPSSCKAVSETGVNHLVKFHNSPIRRYRDIGPFEGGFGVVSRAGRIPVAAFLPGMP